MKRIIAVILTAAMLFLLGACSGGEESNEVPTTEGDLVVSESETTDTSAPPIEDAEIVATLTSKSGSVVTVNGKGSVVIEGTEAAAEGDTLVITAPTNYLKVEAKGISDAVIVYLPDKTFTYVHTASVASFLPDDFKKDALSFTFSTPTDDELAAVRNLAVNPFDAASGTTAFPHATTSNEYDQTGQFSARNAIDGYTSNKGHVGFPYQSWGPTSTVLDTDYYTIDFGREVAVSSIALYLRADGFGRPNSHDAYFSEITLEFSDGSSVKINPEKIADQQTFAFEEKTTTFVKLTGFVTDASDSQGWAAITEVQVMGAEA